MNNELKLSGIPSDLVHEDVVLNKVSDYSIVFVAVIFEEIRVKVMDRFGGIRFSS